MHPIASPAIAMTTARTTTLWQRGMMAKTTEMAREDAKRASKDWDNLEPETKTNFVVTQMCIPCQLMIVFQTAQDMVIIFNKHQNSGIN